jgi:hypothetical protein
MSERTADFKLRFQFQQEYDRMRRALEDIEHMAHATLGEHRYLATIHSVACQGLGRPKPLDFGDYNVRCKCGWQGEVSLLVIRDGKHLCPQCEALFVFVTI